MKTSTTRTLKGAIKPVDRPAAATCGVGAIATKRSSRAHKIGEGRELIPIDDKFTRIACLCSNGVVLCDDGYSYEANIDDEGIFVIDASRIKHYLRVGMTIAHP